MLAPRKRQRLAWLDSLLGAGPSSGISSDLTSRLGVQVKTRSQAPSPSLTSATHTIVLSRRLRRVSHPSAPSGRGAAPASTVGPRPSSRARSHVWPTDQSASWKCCARGLKRWPALYWNKGCGVWRRLAAQYPDPKQARVAWAGPDWIPGRPPLTTAWGRARIRHAVWTHPMHPKQALSHPAGLTWLNLGHDSAR